MRRSPLRLLAAAFGWCWRALDATRRALLNLALLAVLAGLAWFAFFRSGPPPLQERTTLVVAPAGPLHEQASGSLRGGALDQLRGRTVAQTRLRDLLAAFDAAARDPQVERVLLLTDDFAGAGLASLREVAAAMQRFKASGKPIVAWGSAYDQRQYFLAAHASEVWLHPMGGVEISGFGAARSYLKDALDKLGVTAHVIRAGEYKNAAETFVASGPSPQTMEADKLLFDTLWARYTGDIEAVRKLPAGALQKSIEQLPELLAAARGDVARMVLDLKLVDALKTHDEMRAALVERGVKDGKSFRQVGLGAYLARQKPRSDGDALAVIVAEGAIVDGQAPGGMVGGLSTGELIRAAREDDLVKAVVLRVDSPGGSPFGSELIRRELELTRAAGKPVVVSMGDLAASGGYWIALAADEVIADEATITGSIGVVALLPTAEKALATLGVNSAGYATSWLVGAYDPRRGLDPRFEAVIQAGVDHVYADFTGKAAAARKTAVDKIDAVGRGRVWTGAQAKERGLVDRTGSFGDALKAAATRAKLADGHAVRYLERSPGRLERALAWLGAEVAAALGPDEATALPAFEATLAPWAKGLLDDAAWLAAGVRGGPPAALVHCLCTAP